MNTHAHTTGTTPTGGAASAGTNHRPGSSTDTLLILAALAGPLFYLSSLVQGLTRDGFDLREHPLSQLATGDLGWIQMVSFVAAGLGTLALAAAYRRVHCTGAAHRLVTLGIGLFGVGFVVAGLFPMDPQNGFPVGAPDGVVSLSWHAIVHVAAAVVAFLGLAMACVVRLVQCARRRQTAPALGHGLVAVALLLPVSPTGASIQVALTGLVAFGWVTVVSLRMRADL
ncbi:DUF998 domain-containing protein [Nocardioides sp.]|uniref:DUF998 domain-containing protein n=1 Tax=Nocardioides sp. TaxID=35761 RepID=UPI0027374A02|nr:DUF998 domain-containing protein [Nocardioides sp.]MDP3890281.1 DUF998 domain-containing protein [Nocardioides sp.]